MNSDYKYAASIVRDHVEQLSDEISPDLREKIEALLTVDSRSSFWRAGDELTRFPIGDNERVRALVAVVMLTMSLSYRLNVLER